MSLDGFLPNLKYLTIELLKNSLVPINKTASIDRFHKIETDGELIFQQF
ncbi:hypothetical protein G436_3910 [Leptospira interrogans serovar Hardjo str. Norma]|uniref:Uncharacterized protein n=1 Tax=Leptospira interrogans serovar Hardjo str. Norma TaxID=1279460 RepID=A0A0M5L902_LEPIR|nr:hypothetical protein G436_3910 [Leptospira interrogans serovar Hardjo str. Norma]